MTIPRELWRPDPARLDGSALAAVAEAAGLPLEQGALWRWSVNEPEAFWRAVWEHCGVVGEPGERVLVDGDRMPGARFFPDARLSFAENLLRAGATDEAGTAPAVIALREDGRREELSHAALRDRAMRMAAWLRGQGVGPGDAVASLLPNGAEALVAMLGAAAIGAVWSSCSPEFGDAGVLDRFTQLRPKVLFAPEAHRFKGRVHDGLRRLPVLTAALSELGATVLVTDDGLAPEGVTTWQRVLESPPLSEPLPRFAFDHPLYVLFSSGTTGRPKGIVHGQGGTLLQHLKEHQLHVDLRPGERLFYYTTTGWMMWNWLVSGLASGATLVLWDGSPAWPTADALWRMAADERVDVFGTSARYLDTCRNQGLRPVDTHDLDGVRAILSTGSPLLPETFDHVHDAVAPHAQIASISGGTDIVSCFALGSPLSPTWRGELSCRGLGMDVAVFDDSGNPVVEQPGELVCRRPFPSMPTGFLDDPDGARYRAAYFERYPGVWHHGDWCTLTERGSLVITGRSDTTLNPGGVRIGTAEIYRRVETFAAIDAAIAVGQDDGAGDQRIVLFVVLREGTALDDELSERLRRDIRNNLTPRHVPAVIAAAPDLPRTRSGKLSEVAVRDALNGRPIANTAALENPEALAWFTDFAARGET